MGLVDTGIGGTDVIYDKVSIWSKVMIYEFGGQSILCNFFFYFSTNFMNSVSPCENGEFSAVLENVLNQAYINNAM